MFRTLFKGVSVCLGQTEALEAEENLDNYIIRDPNDNRNLLCNICRKVGHGSRSNVRKHIESKHFPGRYQYPCPDCNVVVYTRIALEVHRSTYHKQRNAAHHSSY